MPLSYLSRPLASRLADYQKAKAGLPVYYRGNGFDLCPRDGSPAQRHFTPLAVHPRANPPRFALGDPGPVFVARDKITELAEDVPGAENWNLSKTRNDLPRGLRVRIDYLAGPNGEIVVCAVDENGEARELFPSSYRFAVPQSALAGVQLFAPPPAGTLLWIEDAEDIARSIRYAWKINSHLARGYYVDGVAQDETASGVVLRLSHGRFLAGVADPYNFNGETMAGPCVIETGEVFTDENDAARAADHLAERYAENERDFQREEREKFEKEEAERERAEADKADAERAETLSVAPIETRATSRRLCVRGLLWEGTEARNVYPLTPEQNPQTLAEALALAGDFQSLSAARVETLETVQTVTGRACK